MNNFESPNRVFENQRYVISIADIFFCLIIVYSFCAHIILYTFSGRVYAIGILVLTVMYALTGTIYKEKLNLTKVLLFSAAIVIAIGYVRTRRNDTFIDFIVILCGYIWVHFHGSNRRSRYFHALKVILYLGLFFSIGVLLQALLPGIHRTILRAFPPEFANAILVGIEDTMRGVRGFTTNSGHAAGFICSGILSAVAQMGILRKTKKKMVIPLAILFLGLVFTGKRGPTVFVVMTIMLFYLIPYRGSEKVKRYWRIFIVLFLLVILYFGLGDIFIRVPLMNEIIRTIEGISANEDVSSSRLALYVWALEIFKENPLFGIGWGMYRTTVVGTITYSKALDTHNIYLQLLAETGIVGFTVFATLFAVMWIRIKNAYIKSLSIEIPTKWRAALSFSFLYQTFFLLYGLSENTLYDQHYQILYMVSFAIFAAYQFALKYFLEI